MNPIKRTVDYRLIKQPINIEHYGNVGLWVCDVCGFNVEPRFAKRARMGFFHEGIGALACPCGAPMRYILPDDSCPVGHELYEGKSVEGSDK